MDVTDDILDFTLGMARKTAAAGIVLYADLVDQTTLCTCVGRAQRPVFLVTSRRERVRDLEECGAAVILVPGVRFSRIGRIKIALLLGLNQGMFKEGDRLICLGGVPEKHGVDTVVFLTVGGEYEIFTAGGLGKLSRTHPEVLSRVLDIAVSLGAEGREGHPVGALFVIGDTERVLEQSRQLVLNPFKGHPEEERNILDPNLKETVKEFSTIDGAFLIREDGLIVAAGVFLQPAISGGELPAGLGARHASAAGITASTSAAAVTVSASTGNVALFRKGRMITEVEHLRVRGFGKIR